MWIAFGILSVIFTIINFVFALNKKETVLWTTLCAISFMALTISAEYSLVNSWVIREDWVALMDVVPSTNTSMTGYALSMIILNMIAILLYRSKKNA